MNLPRLLIAGTHSGVGKTTVTLGLIQAFLQRGLRVQPFKSGPDYIDPGYHSEAAGRPCRNLDTWLTPPNQLTPLFQRACAGADLALMEGVMGLYDGIGATGERGSTAELAKRLNSPVLLVLDASALSRSAAAIVQGYVGFDRDLKIAGCFLNRVAGEGHYRLVKEGIEKLTGTPVAGYLPRDPRLELPERHLGLVPSQEGRSWRKILGPLSARIRQGVDLAAVERMAKQAPPLGARSRHRVPGLRPGTLSKQTRHPVPIGVAMDEAFHFYYPENLELLQDLGAEVVPFSLLKDSHLPRGLGALYLGGGFPEIFASDLSKNRQLHQQIRQAIAAGIPTYAECGGLMALSQGITDTQGRRIPMIGILPGEVRMTDRLQHFGYATVQARRPSLMAQVGERARGHEFHHSLWTGTSSSDRAAYTAVSRYAGKPRREGFARRNLLASYIHLHFLSQPRWAKRFVQAARNWEMITDPGGYREAC